MRALRPLDGRGSPAKTGVIVGWDSETVLGAVVVGVGVMFLIMWFKK